MSKKKAAPASTLSDSIASALAVELSKISASDKLEDRLAVINTAIKYEALQRKTKDEGWGSAFGDDDDG